MKTSDLENIRCECSKNVCSENVCSENLDAIVHSHLVFSPIDKRRESFATYSWKLHTHTLDFYSQPSVMERGWDLLFITLHNCRAGCISEVTSSLISGGNTSWHRPQVKGEVLKHTQRPPPKIFSHGVFTVIRCVKTQSETFTATSVELESRL